MPVGGRPRDPVSEHFHEVAVGGKLFARFIYCQHQMSNKACRMKAHVFKCGLKQNVPPPHPVPEPAPQVAPPPTPASAPAPHQPANLTPDHDIDATIISRVVDFNLFSQARDLKAHLKPIVDAINIFQSDSTGLAKCCETWIDLLNNPVLDPHKAAVKKHFEKAVLPCHFVADLLHPVYRGAKLTEAQETTAMEWITSFNAEFLGATIAFQTQSPPYPSYMFKANNLHPATWWLGMKRFNLPEGFAAFALALQTATCSSASIERVFSTFSLVHSKLRNRLGPQKAAKLVFCYRMLRGQAELDY
ncbi:hypothetical protein GJAV_G00182630 [Gymnothorax javanicus]|nr:hypothetical protein GJAV_G00182630 [Gymnothorax javanicus]